VPVAEREAEVVWKGTLARGAGELSSGSGVLDGFEVTWASRTEAPGGKTSPEELIAAAHASCFAMALSLVLGEAHATPDRVVVDARCVLDEVGGAPRIVRSALRVQGRVSGIDSDGFERALEQAKSLCPVSNALSGNVDIDVEASFEEAQPATTAAGNQGRSRA